MRISKNERHIRWNWESSPDLSDGVRYHFIVVDNKNRGATLNKIIEQIKKWGMLIPIRQVEEKVRNSDMFYLFRSYDSDISPREINFSKIGRRLKRDYYLSERKRGSIEDYVARIYH